MRWIKVWWLAMVATVLLSGAVVAGQLVDQGSPGFQGPWPVKVTNGITIAVDGGLTVSGAVTVDGGFVYVTERTHGACTHTEMHIDGGSYACPPTPLVSRSSILIELVTPGENLRVTSDGVTPASPDAGLNVVGGNNYSDNLAGTVQNYCSCGDGGTLCDLAIVECP